MRHSAAGISGWVVAIGLLFLGPVLPARGATLGAGDLLVSEMSSGVLHEYTPAGALVQSFNLPDFEHGFYDLRDITVGAGGSVYAYNGTFTPQLSTLEPASGTITSQPFAGWSTVNNISFGGIGALGDGVYVTDMSTVGGAPAGLVRFSTTGGAPARFGQRQYTDLTIGGDGLLYALSDDSQIDVYDPGAGTSVLRTIAFDLTLTEADIRGIAVSRTGNIYAAGWNGRIYAATPDGALINSRASGTTELMDIDLNDAGQLLVGSGFGRVILTDTALASQTSFNVSGSSGPSIHTAFAAPLTVPEPASAGLIVTTAIVIASRRQQRA